MPVTRQAAQALSTDSHIVDGTDDDNRDVKPADCVVHQSHRYFVEQCGGSEWGHQEERVNDIVHIDNLAVARPFVSVESLFVGQPGVGIVSSNNLARLGYRASVVR